MRFSEIDEAEFSTDQLRIDFSFGEEHNFIGFSFMKRKHPHLMHFPSEIEMNEDEMRTLYQLFEKAPFYFYCYYYRYLFQIQQRQMKKQVIVYNEAKHLSHFNGNE